MEHDADTIVLSALAVDRKWEQMCYLLSKLGSEGNLLANLQKELVEYGHPFLHIVAERGDSDGMNMVLNIIDVHEDIFTLLGDVDERGRNLVHITAAKSPATLKCVLDKLEREARLKLLSECCKKQQTALVTAIEHNNIKAVKVILESIDLPMPPLQTTKLLNLTNDQLNFLLIPSNDHCSALHMAGSLGYDTIFESLLNSLGSKERMMIAQHENKVGENLLHCSAAGGNPKVGECLQRMVPAGVFWDQLVERLDHKANNPLHHAGISRSSAFMEEILKHVAPHRQLHLLTQQNEHGKTPVTLLKESTFTNKDWIHAATAFGKKQAFRSQVVEDTPDNQILGRILRSTPYEDRFNTTLSMISMKEPLWDMLVQRSIAESVSYLQLERPYADKMELMGRNIKRIEGRTVLHQAAVLGDKRSMTKLLYLAGPNRNNLLKITDEHGNRPDHFASDNEAKRLLAWTKDSKEGFYFLPTPPQVLIMFNTAEREGANDEMISIAQILPIKFNVLPIIKRDLTGEEMLSAIHKVIHNCKDAHGISGLLVIIMSHGGKDAVCDKNGNLVPIQDIIDGMSPPHIDGIPKVLIMQCCQARIHSPTTAASTYLGIDVPIFVEVEDKNEEQDGVVQHDARAVPPPVSPIVSPYHLTKSNMAILISTVSGGLAERNVFIPTLAQELQQSAVSDDIHDVFLRTHQKMKIIAKNQTPRYESTMTYKLNLSMIFKQEDPRKPQTTSTKKSSLKRSNSSWSKFS